MRFQDFSDRLTLFPCEIFISHLTDFMQPGTAPLKRSLLNGNPRLESNELCG